jgi:stearoyl-CoA desaturase (delta-9 desaturase)
VALPTKVKGEHRVAWQTITPFVVFNFMPLLVLVTGVTRRAVIMAVVLYVVRAFCITAGYHRYFAHRSYRLARVPQLLLAVGGLTAVQKGPLWWASTHREHHRYADTDRDPHSPQHGFWWSHVGWILSGRRAGTDWDNIDDFARFPELRWLTRHDWVGPWGLGALTFLIGGWSGLIVGFFLSTVLLWHATFFVNSLSHLAGRRRFATPDTSRNNWFVAILVLGEGWHNNHHHYPACARQGLRWWEYDPTYWVLKVLSWMRIVKDLRQPTPAALSARRLSDGALDVGMIRYRLSQAATVAATASPSVAVPAYEALDEVAGDIEGIGRSGRRGSTTGTGTVATTGT